MRNCEKGEGEGKNKIYIFKNNIMKKTHLSSLVAENSALFSGFVWIRRLTVRTNWPTVAEKPDRKALKGWYGCVVSKLEGGGGGGTEGSFLLRFPLGTKTYIVPCDDAVHKLQPPDDHQKRHEDVYNLHPLRRLAHVAAPDRLKDVLCVVAAAAGNAAATLTVRVPSRRSP